MDKVTVWNQALALLGDREYIVGTPSARAVDQWWPSVLREALMLGAWSWAKKRKSIAENTDENDKPNGTFTIPDDCIRLLKVGADAYSIIGREIVVERLGNYGGIRDIRNASGKVLIEYMSDDFARQEVMPDWNVLFTKGVVLMLASKVAIKLSSDINTAQGFEQLGMQWLKQALWEDVVQSQSNDQDPLDDILKGGFRA